MSKKLCVFPNDALIAYYNKGEIKDRYFNPDNLFDEIHVISFVNEDVDEEKVKQVAGNAIFKIHCVGDINLLNMRKKKETVKEIIKKINPNVIRTYNPLVNGWIATYCSKKLGIPLVVSLHGEYDRFRHMIKKQNFKQYLKLLYTSKFIEPIVLRNADRVICVYKTIIPYAKKMGAKKIDLIYNRVDLSKFSKHTTKNKIPLIITVGRLIKQKNHEIIIRAIVGLNVNLLIIGDGNDFERLENLVKNLGLKDRVTFKRHIPHSEIHEVYKLADIFALAMRTDLESLPIPVLEAMASGLPIIIPKPVSSNEDEELGDGVILVDNKPEAFNEALAKIISDQLFSDNLSKKTLENIKRFDGKIMEEKERKLYEEILQK